MDGLIEDIYHHTVEMGHRLQEEDMTSFLEIIAKRNDLMDQVDSWKVKQSDFQYTSREKELLQEILAMDQAFVPLLTARMAQTQSLLHQHKKNKAFSKKYHPYMKQTSGAFVDSKK